MSINHFEYLEFKKIVFWMYLSLFYFQAKNTKLKISSCKPNLTSFSAFYTVKPTHSHKHTQTYGLRYDLESEATL